MNETDCLLNKINSKLGWILFILLFPYFAFLFWLGTIILVALA